MKTKTAVALALAIVIATLAAASYYLRDVAQAPAGPARWRHLAKAIKIVVLFYRSAHS